MRLATRTIGIATAAAVAASLLTATAVIAAGRSETGTVAKATDTQVLLWRTGQDNRAFTTSKDWQILPMPDGGCTVGASSCVTTEPPEFILSARGPISLTFSGLFSNAPVELRFWDEQHYMEPGTVRFTPHPGNNAFSFTFVSTHEGDWGCGGPELQWRSPTGAEVLLNRATIVVHYKKTTAQSPPCM